MAEQWLVPRCPEKRMNDSAVAHIHFGRAHEALREVGGPGLQSPHEQEIHQNVEVARDGLPADSQAGSGARGVEQLALTVCQLQFICRIVPLQHGNCSQHRRAGHDGYTYNS